MPTLRAQIAADRTHVVVTGTEFPPSRTPERAPHGVPVQILVTVTQPPRPDLPPGISRTFGETGEVGDDGSFERAVHIDAGLIPADDSPQRRAWPREQHPRVHVQVHEWDTAAVLAETEFEPWL